MLCTRVQLLKKHSYYEYKVQLLHFWCHAYIHSVTDHMLRYIFTGVVLHCVTGAVLHCVTGAVLHYVIGAMLHCVTGAMLHCVTGAMLHCVTGAMLHCVTGAMLHCVTGAVLHYVIGAMLHCVTGARCRGRGDCVECLLSALQVVHTEAHPQTGGWSDHPLRQSLHPRPRLHVHQVCVCVVSVAGYHGGPHCVFVFCLSLTVRFLNY